MTYLRHYYNLVDQSVWKDIYCPPLTKKKVRMDVDGMGNKMGGLDGWGITTALADLMSTD